MITVNCKSYDYSKGINLIEIIEKYCQDDKVMKISDELIIVLNDKSVKLDEAKTVLLNDGDKIVLLYSIAGG